MPSQTKYYVVWKGRKRGIYPSWRDCEAQVSGVPGAEFMSFSSQEQARTAFSMRYADVKAGLLPPARMPRIAKGGPPPDSIGVDASCIGNPGPMEYRGVHLGDARLLFHVGPVQHGTNNIGEFLAIVHALEYLHTHGKDWPVYSDSQNAIAWVRAKTCRTKLPRNTHTEKVFTLIAKAEGWLRANKYTNKVVKWKTEEWGEVPADFGRK